ncbi:MAG TPA: hypothetical protein VG738_19670 [Chitinophagaceae bacterium]|nr:hypothetical protein [Chitinophagaceae bacterium]
MKKLLFVLFVFTGLYAHSQTWNEWFAQKKTKKKYLLQQIAALQTYIGYAEKGYKIASEGLHTIEDIKHGELGLHSTYFNSLKTVNPNIKNAAEVAATIAVAAETVQYFKHALQQFKSTGQFNGDELLYISGVYSKLVNGIAKNLDALLAVTADAKLQMTDDERIRCINSIYAEAQGQQAFAQSFVNGGFTMVVQRQAETIDNNIIKGFYNSK